MIMKLSTRIGVVALAAALAAGPTTASATAGAAPVERKAAFKPALSASSSKVVAGKRLILAGKVKPATKGGVVLLQKRLGDSRKWTDEARLKVGRKGTYHYTDKPHAAGVRHYRVVAPKAGRIAAGRSKAVKVTVYRWQSLSKVDIRSQGWTYLDSSLSINAKEYGPAFVGANYNSVGSVDWNLERACLRLKARFGNSDESDDLATATVSLIADGETSYTKTFALAQSEERSIDITGVFRLGFHWTSANPDGPVQDQSGASAVFAEPVVLCAF
jgi:hypothetical protein